LLKNISNPVKFHIKQLTDPIAVWAKLEALYGIVDEDMAYIKEDKLLKLDPSNFDTIKDYLTQVDMYRTQLKDCGEPIKDGKMIKHIMTHLPPEYAPFVSSFNTHKLKMGSAYVKPSFEKFSEMLIVEHDSLVGMGLLKTSKTKALVENEGNSSGKNSNKKQKQWKAKLQDDTQQSSSKQQSSSNQSSSTQHSSSQQGKSSSKNNQKGNNSNKREKKTCSYCKRNGHDEHECKDKQIDELVNLMRKHKVDVPNAYKDKGSSTTSKGKGQAFIASTNNPEEWVLDSGATHHMGASREHFSSLKPPNVPYIYVGNDNKI
jgi:hypothetical protein